MKVYTDLEQAKELAKILPIESADMCWQSIYDENHMMSDYRIELIPFRLYSGIGIPCWSLAALMELMNRNCFNVSLHCSGAEWTVSFDDSEHFKSTCEDEAIDAAFKMIVKLKEQKLL